MPFATVKPYNPTLKPYNPSSTQANLNKPPHLHQPKGYEGTIDYRKYFPKSDYRRQQRADKFVPERSRRYVKHRKVRGPPKPQRYVTAKARLHKEHRKLALAPRAVMAPTYERLYKQHRRLTLAPLAGFVPTMERRHIEHRKLTLHAAPLVTFAPNYERRHVEHRSLKYRAPPEPMTVPTLHPATEPRIVRHRTLIGPPVVVQVAAAARGNTPSPILTPPHHRPQQRRVYSPIYYPVRRSPTPSYVFTVPIYASDVKRYDTPVRAPTPVKPRARSPFLYESPTPRKEAKPLREARYLKSYHTPREPFFSPMIPVESKRDPMALRMSQAEAYSRNERSKYPLIPYAEYFGLQPRARSPLDYSYHYEKEPRRNRDMPSYTAVSSLLRSLHGYRR